MGIHTPAHIVTEIDDYRAKISDLETDIMKLLERELRPRVSEYDAFVSMLSVIGNDAASAWIASVLQKGNAYIDMPVSKETLLAARELFVQH